MQPTQLAWDLAQGQSTICAPGAVDKFTNTLDQGILDIIDAPPPPSWLVDGFVRIWTDGSTLYADTPHLRSCGAGAYFGATMLDFGFELSFPTTGFNRSNNRAELEAVLAG